MNSKSGEIDQWVAGPSSNSGYDFVAHIRDAHVECGAEATVDLYILSRINSAQPLVDYSMQRSCSKKGKLMPKHEGPVMFQPPEPVRQSLLIENRDVVAALGRIHGEKWMTRVTSRRRSIGSFYREAFVAPQSILVAGKRLGLGEIETAIYCREQLDLSLHLYFRVVALPESVE